jgi:hypothetical protein
LLATPRVGNRRIAITFEIPRPVEFLHESAPRVCGAE